MLRGSVLTRSLLGKSIRPDYRKVDQMWLRGPSEPDCGDRRGCWGGFGLGWGVFVGAEATSGTVGVVAGVVEVALGAAVPFWFGDIKQNSPET